MVAPVLLIQGPALSNRSGGCGGRWGVSVTHGATLQGPAGACGPEAAELTDRGSLCQGRGAISTRGCRGSRGERSLSCNLPWEHCRARGCQGTLDAPASLPPQAPPARAVAGGSSTPTGRQSRESPRRGSVGLGRGDPMDTRLYLELRGGGDWGGCQAAGPDTRVWCLGSGCTHGTDHDRVGSG